MARSMSLLRGIAVAGALSLVLTACAQDDEGGGEGGDEAAGSNQPEFLESRDGKIEPVELPDKCKGDDPPNVKGNDELTIGTLLPKTGSLAFLGPPEFAGVDLAIQEINEAGGALGKEVKKVHGDSGDAQTPIASKTVDTLNSKNADAIIGAASSGVSLSVIDKITGNGTLMMSPANTSDELSTYCDKGLYFRTAPPDQLQGAKLAEVVAEDGAQKVAILALQDAYGTGLAKHTKQNLEDSNIAVEDPLIYDPKAPTFSTEITKIKNSDPDAIVLIGFDETKKIIPEMLKQGIGPKEIPLYLVDGNLSDYSEDFDPGTLGENVKGTLPGAEAPDEFRKKLLEVDPKLKDWNYSAESYDAANLIALAAEAAGSDTGPDIAKELPGVSKDGTECNDFASCKELLDKDEDIDYQGVSGPIDFHDNGDPGAAFIGIYQYK